MSKSSPWDGFSSANPDHVEMAEEATRLRISEAASDLSKVLNTYAGRSVLWSVLVAAGLDGVSFAGEAPMTMAYNEGRRSVAVELRDAIFTLDPEKFTIMRHEASEREERYARASGFSTYDEEDQDGAEEKIY